MRPWITRALLAVFAIAAITVVVLRATSCSSQAAAPPARSPFAPTAIVPSTPSRVPNEVWLAASVAASDDDPPGALRLEGQVIGADDAPVPGATVTLNANPARSVTADEHGSFFFEGLLARQYTVVAVADAGVAGPATIRLTQTSDPLILRVHAGASAKIAIVDGATRAGIAGAVVELRALAAITATAGADGVALVAAAPPGDYLLVARADGFAPTYRRVRLGAGRSDLRVELHRGGEIAGTVRDPRGHPIAGARVTWSDAGNPAADLDPRRDGVETDADGAFRLAPIPAGTLRIIAHHADRAPGISRAISVAAGQAITGVEIVLDDPAVVAGRVVRADGARAPGVAVRLTTAPGGAPIGEPRQAITGADGTFEIRALPRRPVMLVAVGEDAASERVQVDLAASPEQRDVTLALAIAGRISGVVLQNNQPVEGAEVWASPVANTGDELLLRGPLRDLTDAGGRFTLSGVRDGRYELRTRAPGDPDHHAAWLREPVNANAGDSNVVIRLAGDGGISGKVAFADGSTPSAFTVAFGAGPRVPFSSSDGAFRITPVPPGDYTIVVGGVEFDERQVAPVHVKSGRTTDLGSITVRRGRRLIGRVITPDGTPVAGAVVAAGRRILGGGARLADDTQQMPGFGGTRRTTTDETGGFVVSGLGDGELAIVAEHERLGRSSPTRIGAGIEAQPLEIVVTPFATIEGAVTRNGRPFAGAILNATPQSATGMMFAVVAGPDGAYRFDRLAADTYTLAAVAGADPARGFGAYSRTLTLAAGQTRTLDIAIDDAGVALLVLPRADRPLIFAQVFLVAAAAHPRNGLELEAAVAGSPRWGVAYFTGGAPAKLEGVAPGSYSICVEPLPIELTTPATVWAYVEREGDGLPVFCVPVDVGAAPPAAPIDVQVTIPPYKKPENPK